jgi:Acetyltransferases
MGLSYSITTSRYELAELDSIASLWNANAAGRHAFFPWSGQLLQLIFTASHADRCSFLCEAAVDGRVVGFAHATYMYEYGYAPGGAVEALLVDKQYRNQGIGSRLLAMATDALERVTPRLELIDAMGAWPYGCVYTTLADGSERSGIFAEEPELKRLFSRAGFNERRPSLVMRAPTRPVEVPIPVWMQCHTGMRRCDTWLDNVFRSRELWDHNLVDWKGSILSRAIYGFMPGESKQEGKNIYSLFGVNTPPFSRGKGHASKNIDHLLAHVGALGGDEVEIHVYADNDPALALYAKCGFKELNRTMMMQREL